MDFNVHRYCDNHHWLPGLNEMSGIFRVRFMCYLSPECLCYVSLSRKSKERSVGIEGKPETELQGYSFTC